MEIRKYTVSELKNMKFPMNWAKQNKEKICTRQFNPLYSIPIIANIEGKKIEHILSEFDYVSKLMFESNNSTYVTCILYEEMSKDDAMGILLAQENNPIENAISQIRYELDLLTDEEKKLARFNAAFNVEKDNVFKEINTKYEGSMRKINERSLLTIYEKNRLDEVFEPIKIGINQQASILSDYTRIWIDLFVKKDENIVPRIALIRYLWSLYPAIYDLMITNKIVFNSDEYKEMIENIGEEIVFKNIEKLLSSFNAETNTFSVANRHSNAIRKKIKSDSFNPFDN